MGIRTRFNPMGGYNPEEDDEPVAELTDWRYTTESNGVRTLDEYLGTDTNIVVPSDKTQINSHATAWASSYQANIPFCNKQNLVSVDLNEVPFKANLAVYTFFNSKNIVSVSNINSKVTNMYGTFSNCYNLAQAPNIPNSVTNMASTFSFCNKLTQAPVIPNSVTSMPNTFSNCYNLTQAPNIPNSVTNMASTFPFCYNLTQAPNIPNSVTDMSYTFYFCRNLTQAPNIPNSVTNMAGTFESCSNLTQAPNIPNSVTDMSYTFYGCYNLTQAPVIPNSVTSMPNTFRYCNKLTQAPVIPNSVTSMTNTFESCSNLTQAPNIPNSVTNMASTFESCSNLAQAPVIPNSVTSMPNTFRYCNKLTQAPNIPNSVTNMAGTFESCSNLTQAPNIPNSVTNMASTFYGCYNLTQAPVIPNSVTSMTNTFSNCINLTGNIYIHSENITGAALCFTNANLAKNVYIPYTYSNGEYTKTYNTFQKAHYFNGINGVTMLTFQSSVNWSAPDNATIYFNNGIVTRNPEYVSGSTVNYVAYHPEYIPVFGALTDLESGKTYDLNITMSKEGGVSFAVVPDQSDYTITYTYGDNEYSTTSDSVVVLPNTEVKYVVKCKGFKTITGTYTVIENTTLPITLEVATTEEADLSYPFDAASYSSFTLDNLVDGSNFEISSAANAIISGSSSYNVNNGKSIGYIEFTTPEEETELSVSCYTSSESNYDFGGAYIGTAIYTPSSYSDLRNQKTDGNGSWLYTGSGTNTSPTEYTTTLQANTKYYLQFYYMKDGSSNKNDDRFYITNIKFSAVSV